MFDGKMAVVAALRSNRAAKPAGDNKTESIYKIICSTP